MILERLWFIMTKEERNADCLCQPCPVYIELIILIRQLSVQTFVKATCIKLYIFILLRMVYIQTTDPEGDFYISNCIRINLRGSNFKKFLWKFPRAPHTRYTLPHQNTFPK